MEEVHDGEYRPHMNAHMLARKIIRLGYYWTTIEVDCRHYVRQCHNYQIFANVQHTNGAVEAANKTLTTILRKMCDNYKDWPLKIPFALWGYRTSIRTATGATSYYLVYGMEAVQPIELEVQLYQKRIERAFNKKGKPRKIKEGDLVLKSVRALLLVDPRGKFKPNWTGPYLVKRILTGGAVQLTDLDGNDFSNPTNLDQLKKYYP
ncbi:uncharacterized protein LOC141619541 [Silene latifolia]|uniref:uncharacterized protein LOC141619541 n=1 Tax=Silene latifolia TaxID=37657 RepID=UPI003D7888F5